MKNIYDICELCYELYILDWKSSHKITTEEEMEKLKDFYKNYAVPDCSYTYENYLKQHCYKDGMYVCYEEFCDTEYQDEEYIAKLLNDSELYMLYLEDLWEM